ncbi:hypothetical protein LGM31_34475, partial [Burkholderia vietnamiensis]|nr:hypothetical protein [Burkholderia vietnamiensis]
QFAGVLAVHEGANPITSPADHRPNRVGNFTSTLLGKLRPTLTGELRQARWEEFDLDNGLLYVPSSRLKRTKREKANGHRIIPA